MRNRPSEFANTAHPRDKGLEFQRPIKTIAPPVPQVEFQTQAPAKQGATWPRQRKVVFWSKVAGIDVAV